MTTKSKTDTPTSLTEERWAEVVARLGLVGNPYLASHLWAVCECGKPVRVGQIVSWSCVQDDGSFEPSVQVIDRSGTFYFMDFLEDGIDFIAFAKTRRAGGLRDLAEPYGVEIQPIFANSARRPTPNF